MDYIDKAIKTHLNEGLPNHPIREVYQWAVFPLGKVFRPKLVWAIQEDFSGESKIHSIRSNHALLATSIELHHAYTLIHDDLPCMDDDDMRRGKESTHKKFGEWKALLSGDGLLNLSYSLLSKINHTNSQTLIRIYSHACGPKGLILGQVMDLSGETTQNFPNLLETHKLKTARLMQLAMSGSYLLLDDNKFYYKTATDMARLGHATGVLFQLIDDLTELVHKKLSPHEKEVNPWPRMKDDCYKEILLQLKITQRVIARYELKKTSEMLSEYFSLIKEILQKDKATIEGHIKLDIGPIIKNLTLN